MARSAEYTSYIQSSDWRKKSNGVRDCVPLSPESHKLIHQDIFWNLNGNNRTPSPLRPFVSNYLRVATVCLMIVNPILAIFRLLRGK